MLDELLCDLAACVCAQLTPDGADGPDLCFCGVAPGAQFAHDYTWECDQACGSAWVRVMTAYPTTGTGIPVDPTTGGCGTLLGVDIEVGVVRCLEAGPDGEPPSAEAMMNAARRQWSDMLAVRTAIRCCSALDPKDYILNSYQPIGPAGLLVGGTWTLSLAI